MSYFRTRNLLLLTAMVLALMLIVIIVIRYQPSDQVQAVVKALPQGVDVKLKDVDYTHIEAGKARWQLIAGQVARQEGSGILSIENPVLRFYNVHGEVDGTLSSESGMVSDDYMLLDLAGDVVLKENRGYTLMSTSMRFNHKTQKASSDDLVTLDADGVRLEGVGFTYDIRLRKMTLSQNVEGVLELR